MVVREHGEQIGGMAARIDDAQSLREFSEPPRHCLVSKRLDDARGLHPSKSRRQGGTGRYDRMRRWQTDCFKRWAASKIRQCRAAQH
jgi:hypothetical protein